MIAEITSRRVRFCLAKDVPDSGQEHPADRDNSFLVTTTGFELAIAFPEFWMLVFVLDHCVGNLNKQRFKTSSCAGDPGRFYLLRALIVAGTAAGPRDKVQSDPWNRRTAQEVPADR